MVSFKSFTEVLNALQQLRPMGKPLSETAIGLAWHTFPEQAKRELSDRDLAWAAGQLLQDPQPPREEAPHMALLRYVYRIGDGRARLDWGLRFPEGTPTDQSFLPRQQPAASLVAGEDHAPPLTAAEQQAAALVRSLVGGMG